MSLYVTAPRPVGRGFPLLRPQLSVRRIYAAFFNHPAMVASCRIGMVENRANTVYP